MIRFLAFLLFSASVLAAPRRCRCVLLFRYDRLLRRGLTGVDKPASRRCAAANETLTQRMPRHRQPFPRPHQPDYELVAGLLASICGRGRRGRKPQTTTQPPGARKITNPGNLCFAHSISTLCMSIAQFELPGRRIGPCSPEKQLASVV